MKVTKDRVMVLALNILVRDMIFCFKFHKDILKGF